MADKAIKQGFDLLIKRILVKEDYSKVSNLDLSSIKGLVTYYNMSNNIEIGDNKIILISSLIKISYIIYFMNALYLILIFKIKNFTFYQY